MSYTPHSWANGENGANAVPWLNNMEEGVRAATEAAEGAAVKNNVNDPNSTYRRIQALRADAQNKRNIAISNYNIAFAASTNYGTRNTMLGIGRSFTEPFIDQYGQISGFIYYGIGDFPYGSGGNTTFRITRDGYYIFTLYLSVNGPNTTLKITRNGGAIETIKLMEFQDVSGFGEYGAYSVSVTKSIVGGSYIGFMIETDASTPRLNAFRGSIRRL